MQSVELPSCDDDAFNWNEIESDPTMTRYLEPAASDTVLSRFLIDHKLKDLQSLFQRHQINIDDLNSWSLDDAKCVDSTSSVSLCNT